MNFRKILDFREERVTTLFEDFVHHIYESDSPEFSEERLAEVNRKIKKEILFLLLKKSYYGSLITHLNVYGSSSLNPKTMCTDGSSIIFHPEFVLKQSPEAIRMVLAHEILHCIGEHMERRGNRDPQLWNVACDFAINPILMNEDGFSWPVNERGERMGLYEAKYEGMRAEEIYDDLIKKYPTGALPPLLISGSGMGGVIDDDSSVPVPDPGLDIQKGIGSAGDEEDDDQLVSTESDLPKVGQRVRLEDGTEAVIKKVFSSGDIEI